MAKAYSSAAYYRRKAQKDPAKVRARQVSAALQAAIGMGEGQTMRINTGGMSPDEALELAGAEIADLPFEMGVLVAPDGTVFVAKGNNGEVTMPFYEATGEGYRRSELMQLHNHPADGQRTIGGPPSDNDWRVMQWAGQTSARVVAPEGSYTMGFKAGHSRIDAIRFFSTSDSRGYTKKSNFMKNVQKEFQKSEYANTHNESLRAAWNVIQKFGPRYGFEVTFTPNPGYEHIYG